MAKWASACPTSPATCWPGSGDSKGEGRLRVLSSTAGSATRRNSVRPMRTISPGFRSCWAMDSPLTSVPLLLMLMSVAREPS